MKLFVTEHSGSPFIIFLSEVSPYGKHRLGNGIRKCTCYRSINRGCNWSGECSNLLLNRQRGICAAIVFNRVFSRERDKQATREAWTLAILHSVLKWNNRFNPIVTVTNDCTRVTVYDLLVGRLVKPSGALSASSLKGPYNFNESI